jgi:hypothetical protein
MWFVTELDNGKPEISAGHSRPFAHERCSAVGTAAESRPVRGSVQPQMIPRAAPDNMPAML